MRKLEKLIVWIVCIIMLAGCSIEKDKKNEEKAKNESTIEQLEGWDKADKIVATVISNKPQFGVYEIDVKAFGGEYLDTALQDTTEDKRKESELAKKNTEALTKAMKDVSSHIDKNGNKGGIVHIGKGYFYTGSIHMESYVNLNLNAEARVMFTTDYSQYENVLTRWEGIICYNYSPFIYAYQKKNIAITGTGIFDGQAAKDKYWLPWKNGSVNKNESQEKAKVRIRQMGQDAVPVEQRVFGEGSYLRPSFLQPYECKNVLIEDITIKNAPFWMVHPVFCENILIRKVTVNSFGYNNDGINPDSCKYALIENCTLNTGDDAIAIKSGLNKDGSSVGVPSEYIVVRNNEYLTGKGSAVTVGSDMSGDVRYIYFIDNHSQTTCDHLQSISLKTNGNRGGTIEQIYIKGLVAEHVEDYSIFITKEFEEGDTGLTTPVIRDVFIKDCKLVGGSKGVIGMIGYDRSPIENINITNCTFTDCNAIMGLWNIKGLVLNQVTFNGVKYPDGEFVPATDNIELLEESVCSNVVTVKYSCGALESEIKTTWYESESENGEYVPVSEEGLSTAYHNIMQERLMNIDSSKYYKLGIKIREKEFLTKAYHMLES